MGNIGSNVFGPILGARSHNISSLVLLEYTNSKYKNSLIVLVKMFYPTFEGLFVNMCVIRCISLCQKQAKHEQEA